MTGGEATYFGLRAQRLLQPGLHDRRQPPAIRLEYQVHACRHDCGTGRCSPGCTPEDPPGPQQVRPARLAHVPDESIAAQARDTVLVKTGVAEQLLQHARAFHEETKIEGIGHAHATVHLHTFLHGQRHRGAGLGFGDGD